MNKTWKQFCILRESKINKNMRSKNYKKLYKELKNHKTNIFNFGYFTLMYEFLDYIKYNKVPKKTYENYLSWKEGLIKL